MIVVLEGSLLYRIQKAYNLAVSDYSNIIYSPGIIYPVNAEFVNQYIKTNTDIQYHEGSGAASTWEEAFMTLDFINNNYPGTRKIILVTSDYHGLRSYMTFSRILDIEIRTVTIRTDFQSHLEANCLSQSRVYGKEVQKIGIYLFLLSSPFIKIKPYYILISKILTLI